LVGNPEEKRLLGRPRRRWESNNNNNNNNIYINETEWEGVNLEQIAGSCEHVNQLLSSIQCDRFI
jgi:hypothetical protein